MKGVNQVLRPLSMVCPVCRGGCMNKRNIDMRCLFCNNSGEVQYYPSETGRLSALLAAAKFVESGGRPFIVR